MTAARGQITCDEIIQIIASNWPASTPPSPMPPRVVELSDGRSLMFSQSAAMEQLAAAWNTSHGPSDDNKKRLLGLNWGEQWVERCVEKPGRTQKNRKIPKSAKIQLLHIYYPKDPPTWKDEIPVALDDNTLWVFKPVEWLDDVSNNWLEGRASVMLTEEERLAMEKMLWVKPWLTR
eukprot:3953243-Prymnesium_polylepis.1